MSNDEIKALALQHGFKLKEQSNGDMDLVTYNYPTGVLAKITDEALLDEAKQRGFYKSYCRWDDLANQFMLGVGRIAFKDSIPRNRHLVFIGFLSDYLTSFTADHADKVAICAMLLSDVAIHPNNHVKAV